MQSRTPQSVRARNGSLARSLCRALPRAVDVPPHLVLELPVGHVSVVVEVLRVAKVVCARALRVIVPDVGELDPAVALRSNPHLSRREPLVALQSTAEAMRHCGVAGAERRRRASDSSRWCSLNWLWWLSKTYFQPFSISARFPPTARTPPDNTGQDGSPRDGGRGPRPLHARHRS